MNSVAFELGGTESKMRVMTREGALLNTEKQTIIDDDSDPLLHTMRAKSFATDGL